jgi:glycosyltransferase involved in cell wall biosynthesis
MTRLVSVFPFDQTAAGFISRVSPLRAGLLANGASLDILLAGRGYRLRWSEQEFVEASPHGGRGDALLESPLPSDLTTAISQLGYFWIGRVVPPFFRLRDLVIASRTSPAIQFGYDGVLCFKPWLRTVAPSLRLARTLDAPAILDLDDFDVSPFAPFIDSFDALSVATRYLARQFSMHDPLLIPNAPPRELVLPNPRTLASEGKVRFLWVYPGTGIPPALLDRTLSAVIRGLSGATITLVGFPRTDTRAAKSTDGTLSVELLPRVSHSELISILDRHDVSLTLEGNSSYERAKGSIRLSESMARGLAILAWQGGETASVINESGGGSLVPRMDFEALTRSISELATNPRLVEELGRKALAFSSRVQSWEDSARQLLRRVGL